MMTVNDLLASGVFTQDANSAYTYDAYAHLTNLRADADGLSSVQDGFAIANAGHGSCSGSADTTTWYAYDYDVRYYGYRYYSPSLGRWLSRDPLLESGQSITKVINSNRHVDLSMRETAFEQILSEISAMLLESDHTPFAPFYGPISLANELNCYDAFFNNPNKYVDPDGEAAMAMPIVVVVVKVAVIGYGGVRTFCEALHFYEKLQRKSFEEAGQSYCPPPSAARDMCKKLGWYNDRTTL